MDEATLRWRPDGRIYLWRYHTERRDYGGLHFTADDAGLASLARLIDLMRAATHQAVATIRLAQPGPTEWHVPTHRVRPTAMTTWTIVHAKTRFAESHWSLTVSGSEARLELGAGRLEPFARGIGDVGNGRGDYSIGGDSDDDASNLDLWFWWRSEPQS